MKIRNNEFMTNRHVSVMLEKSRKGRFLSMKVHFLDLPDDKEWWSMPESVLPMIKKHLPEIRMFLIIPLPQFIVSVYNLSK